MKIHPLIIFISYFAIFAIATTPVEDLKAAIESLKTERSLKGIQVQVTKQQNVVFNLNLGEKNQANDPIDNNTMFRIASVSKSFASVAIMQLVQQNKVSLNQSLSSIFGYTFQNPNFPGVQITVQMVLSHTSSLIECDPYYSNFLAATSNAKTGIQIPDLWQIVRKEGRYYNECLYSKTHKPGTYYQYVNLNFGIAGTIVELISQQRYDLYERDHILTVLSEGLPEVATFNPALIKNTSNVGVLYLGDKGKWVPNYDYYPDGKIVQRNLTDYWIGSNGVIYGPQGSLRASASHLTNYAIMLANGGKTKGGKVILSPKSVAELTKPRYHYHGLTGGALNDFHTYGLGLYSTTYRKTDTIINHEVVKGHTGSAYNLISAQHFWKSGGVAYTLTYIINGALNGYKYGTGTIYQYERLAIYRAVDSFVSKSSITDSSLSMNLQAQ